LGPFFVLTLGLLRWLYEGVLSRLRDELTALLGPVVNGQDVELWELEYNARSGGGLLRIYIDGPNGVTVEDCERVSRAVSAVLDSEDPIPGQYTLEVSSPGLDRVLRTPEHFRRFAGEAVRVETNAPIDGRKRFSGHVTQVGDEAIALEVDGRTVRIPFVAIHKARLIG
jgi:ribosome maturation factor RimP